MSNWWDKWSDGYSTEELYDEFISHFPSNLTEELIVSQELQNLPEIKQPYFALEIMACEDKSVRSIALERIPWLVNVLPLPSTGKHCLKIWDFILRHTVCGFALAPVVGNNKHAELRLFFAIYSDSKYPPYFPESDGKNHPSIERELTLVRQLPKGKLDAERLRLFAFPPHKTTTGYSASLAVAAAAWAAYRDSMIDTHRLCRRLAKKYVISAELTEENKVKAVGQIAAKFDCIGDREFIVAVKQPDIVFDTNYSQVAVFDDVKKRLLPETVYHSELTTTPLRCKLLIGFVSEQIEQFAQIATLVNISETLCLLYSENEVNSQAPMRKLKKILEDNLPAWNGKNVKIVTTKIDDKRLDLIESDILKALDKYGLKENEIIFNITGGMKPMTMAATNAIAAQKIRAIYRDFTNQEYPYMIISYDTNNRLRTANFMVEPPELLGGFPENVQLELRSKKR